MTCWLVAQIISSHNTARTSVATVKVNINLIFIGIFIWTESWLWKDTRRSFYYKSAFDDISKVFRQTDVGTLIYLFSICLQYTSVFYCLNQTRCWISMPAIFSLGLMHLSNKSVLTWFLSSIRHKNKVNSFYFYLFLMSYLRKRFLTTLSF